MTFSLHDNQELKSLKDCYDVASASAKKYRQKSAEIHLFAEKLVIPDFSDYVQRPRLIEVLSKTSETFGTTLVTGRAGTGKTALAANFALRYNKVAWYRVEAADADWNVFSRYFSASIENPLIRRKKNVFKSGRFGAGASPVSFFVENKISEISAARRAEPMLIVLDDIHHVFDAEWFEEFFITLIYSLTPDIHLLFLSRGTPTLPLWRLRSKQVLSVIDEKLLAFNPEETAEFLSRSGYPPEKVETALHKTFGRISQLKRLLEAAR